MDNKIKFQTPHSGYIPQVVDHFLDSVFPEGLRKLHTKKNIKLVTVRIWWCRWKKKVHTYVFLGWQN